MEYYFQSTLFSPEDFPLCMHYDYLSSQYQVLPHWHADMEILYFTKGRANILCNENRLIGGAGDVLFCNAFCFHGLEHITDVCEYYCMTTNLHLMRTVRPSSLPMPAYYLTQDTRVTDAMETIIAEFGQKGHGHALIIEAQLLAALAYISRLSEAAALPVRSGRGQPGKMHEAIAFIHQHIPDKITIADLCKIAQLSPSQFSHTFKKLTGNTPVEYINRVRCQHARNLYRTGKYTVAQCAELCGYNHMPYFARKYRQLYGEPLSRLRTSPP